jgi:hypothetical protein
MTTIEKVEKLKTIQINNLPDLLTNLLGYYIRIDEIKVSDRGYVEIVSQDLTEHTGIMSEYYKSFRVEAFSNNIVSDDDNLYWVDMSFRWMYNSGGSNGHSFKNVFYNFKTKNWFTM